MFKLIYCVSVLLLYTCQGHKFADLASRAVFPPILPDKHEGDLPIGHKEAFGHQNLPKGPIKEYDYFMDPNTLWKTHVEPRTPLVYRNALKGSPALKNWIDDQYLAEKYGDLDVLVEHKREDRSSTSGRMRLTEFLKNYKTDDLYVVTMFPSEMMHEVKVIFLFPLM